MSARILSGTETAQKIKAELKEEVAQLKVKGVEPALAVILVGEDPASQVYVRNKKKACGEIGINSRETVLPKEAKPEQLLKVIAEYNHDPAVDGILCQLPLPKHIPEDEIVRAIDPDKDVDCFHPYNVGRLCIGNPRFLPCTPHGVLQLLRRGGIDLSGADVAILGRSNIVGRPLANLLSSREVNATVTLLHTRSRDLAAKCRAADVLVAAIGVAEYVKADMVKEDAVVVDVGMNRIPDAAAASGTRLVGDVAFAEVKEKASAITPVPGGVGLMTVAMLMYNTVQAARARVKL